MEPTGIINAGHAQRAERRRAADVGQQRAAPHRQHGALALDAREPGRVLRLGQRARADDERLRQGQAGAAPRRSWWASPSSPTPIFSADMQFVIFHPSWGVPPGMKANELRPRCADAGGGWFFSSGGAPRCSTPTACRSAAAASPVDPNSINWSQRRHPAASISPSRRAPTTCWASSNSASPTSMTSTCTTRRSGTCSAERSAPSAMAACACRTRSSWPRCCSPTTRAGRRTRCRSYVRRGGEIKLTKPDPRARHLLHGGRGRCRQAALPARHLRPRQPRCLQARRANREFGDGGYRKSGWGATGGRRTTNPGEGKDETEGRQLPVLQSVHSHLRQLMAALTPRAVGAVRADASCGSL